MNFDVSYLRWRLKMQLLKMWWAAQWPFCYALGVFGHWMGWCSFSTGICGDLTAGWGKLDPNGYWRFPCFARHGAFKADK